MGLHSILEGELYRTAAEGVIGSKHKAIAEGAFSKSAASAVTLTVHTRSKKI
jgi:hypothetical protein